MSQPIFQDTRGMLNGNSQIKETAQGRSEVPDIKETEQGRSKNPKIKPLSYSTARNLIVAIGWLIGLEFIMEFYHIRRGAGRRMNGKSST